VAGISGSFTLLACEQTPARRAEKKLAESEVAVGRLHDPIACEQARTKKKKIRRARNRRVSEAIGAGQFGLTGNLFEGYTMLVMGSCDTQFL